MQERRANLHRLPSRACGEDTAESSSVPHGKASFCWAARLACCRHPAWLHTSCLHQAPVFLQAPQSPRSSGHPGSTDVTLKGLEQWLGSLPEPEPPQGRTALAGQSQPCCKCSFLQLALVCGTGHTGCSWLSSGAKHVWFSRGWKCINVHFSREPDLPQTCCCGQGGTLGNQHKTPWVLRAPGITGGSSKLPPKLDKSSCSHTKSNAPPTVGGR